MNECMISIIMPTYNHEKYIRQALDSIFMQETSYSFEILIGDDCSSDHTQEILLEYQKAHSGCIRLFLREKNIGASRNAYELLTKARGKYLATLEGDDYWTDPHKLQLQVDFLEAHPEYIGCTHRFIIVDENNVPLKNQRLSWVKQKKRFTLRDFGGIMMPGQPSTFVRRNIFREPRYDYSICYKAHSMIADRTLMLIYLLQGSFYCINRFMSSYRKILDPRSDNITSATYYTQNMSKIDFLLTTDLETYARVNFKKNVPFTFFKLLCLTRAFGYFVLNPSSNSKNDFIYIFLHIKHPIRMVLLMPYGFIYLMKQRIYVGR